MAGERRLIGDLLLRCVSEHDWRVPLEGIRPTVERADRELLVRAATFHGVVGCVYRSLRTLLSPDEAEPLAVRYRQSVGAHLRTLADLAELAPVLDALDMPWLVVKGPVLAETVYPEPDLRSYADLDIVVPAARFGQALDAVEGSGGSLLDVNWPLLTELGVGELLLRLPGGTLLDLHWHLVNDRVLRRTFQIPMAELLERARLRRIGSSAIRTLDATDTVLHLCVHGCLSGGDRLVWLKDLERALACDPPDWEELGVRARSWRVTLPVALMLIRARATLGACVPEGATEVLVDRRVWPRIVAVADRLPALERAIGDRSIARMVSRSTRSDTVSSLRQLGRHAIEGSRHPFAPTPPLDMNPESIGSARHASGSLLHRSAFLSAVAAEASPPGTTRC